MSGVLLLCPHKERERAGVRVRRAAIKRFFDGVMAAWQGARAQTKLGIEKIGVPISDRNTLGSARGAAGNPSEGQRAGVYRGVRSFCLDATILL